MTPEKDVYDLCQKIDSTYPNSFLTTYVGWHWNRTDAPMIYGLANGLGLLATNAHPELCAYLGGRVNANLWALLVGPSGWARKTTAIELGKEIQDRVDPSLVGGEPASVEGLVESLAQSPQLTLYIREFGDFLSRTSGKNYLAPLREKLTDLYEGRTIRQQYSRSAREITDPRLTLLAASTPVYLETYTAQVDWEGGFLSRWAIFAGVPERYLPTTSLRPDMADWLVHRLQEIRATPATVCAGMDPAAKERWHAWSRATRTRCLSSNDQWVASAGARIQTFAAKIILLLALDAGVDVSRPWHVNEALVALSIEIAQMAFAGLRYVVGDLAGTRFTRERRNVLRAIVAAKQEQVTLKAILNGTTPRMEKRDVVRVMETLLAEGTAFQVGEGRFSLKPPSTEGMLTL